MTDLHRIVLGLSALGLFAGLASAQITSSPMNCVMSAVVPYLRGEGLTEASGDITLTCSGGNAPAIGAQIPQATFTVFTNTTVTSRLLASGSNVSDALLLIDDPGSNESGYGPSVPQIECPTPNTGCIEYVGTFGSNTYAPVTTRIALPDVLRRRTYSSVW
jgi:hypothetical protein